MSKNRWAIDGGGSVDGKRCPLVWITSKNHPKYGENPATDFGYDDWPLFFDTMREAGTVAYMIAKSMYLKAVFGIPPPKKFEIMFCHEDSAKESLQLIKKFQVYEKYLPLYQDKWLGEVNETHDK